jgi:carbonic anhydrase/acetyltransferase-like protein (isoleucine patch superfamily)
VYGALASHGIDPQIRADPNLPTVLGGRPERLFLIECPSGSCCNEQAPFDRVQMPAIHPLAFIHVSAHVIGDVTIGAGASVWPTSVLRGDTAPIVIGEDSNVQDGTIVHVDHGVPCTIGARVAIGHRAIVHGATVEDDCLIGMGAIVLNRVVVKRGSIVGAGAVCTEGMIVPPNSLVVGVPGRVIRETTDAERERIAKTVESYRVLSREHRAGKHRAHVADS